MARAPMPPPAAAPQMAPDPDMEQGAHPGGDDAEMEQPPPPAKKPEHKAKRKPPSERLYGKKKGAHRHGR